MIFELIILLCLITALILSLLKLFTNIFDNFQDDDLWVNCGNIESPWKCTGNINCRLFNVGGNRNSFERCGSSGVATGAFGNSRIIRS